MLYLCVTFSSGWIRISINKIILKFQDSKWTFFVLRYIISPVRLQWDISVFVPPEMQAYQERRRTIQDFLVYLTGLELLLSEVIWKLQNKKRKSARLYIWSQVGICNYRSANLSTITRQPTECAATLATRQHYKHKSSDIHMLSGYSDILHRI
jgi:hypothetical protein